jgi:hypothetical protein
MSYIHSRAFHADLVVAVVVAISLSGMWYVRRTWLPAGAPIELLEEGSRDRLLHGKARLRARRGH